MIYAPPSVDWVTAADRMVDAARRLQRGGADCIVLCTNTMHRCAPRIEADIALPFIHIADPTAQAIQEAAIQRIGLLGTRYTMEQDFYKGRLTQKFGLDVITPDQAERDLIHKVIYEELVLGVARDESRRDYQRIIKTLADRGAQGVILGCTEITLLIKPEHSVLPVFDTTTLHALAAVDFALGVTEAHG